MSVWFALVLAGCGSGQQQRQVIELEEIVPACPELDTSSVDIRPTPDASHPDAAGYWLRVCDPDDPRAHGREAFVYDGTHVTIVAVDRSTYQPAPPLRLFGQQRPFKLESRWTGDRLEVHVPPWLTYEDDHTTWAEIGRFTQASPGASARFVGPDGVPFLRSDRPMRTLPWSLLGDEHAAVTEYDTADNERGRLTFEYAALVLSACMWPESSGLLMLHLDVDGRVIEAASSRENAALDACVRGAVEAAPKIEGYSAPSRARLRFGFDAEAPMPRITVTPRNNRSVDGWQAIAVDTPGVGAPFITGVWGAAPDDVFAVGSDGIILYFDGRTWSEQPAVATDHYAAVWGHSGQVFVVGMESPGGGTIRHYDGQSWHQQTTPPTPYLSALWGANVDDVFAVGAQGAIFHYDGDAWSEQNSGVTQGLLAVWGSASNDVFAVGHEGTVVHFDGQDWSPMASQGSAHLRGIWGSGRDVFAAGDEVVLRYDGRAWTTALSRERAFLHAISGNSPTDVIAVGSNGIVLRFDGQRWDRNPQTIRGSVHSVDGNRHMLDVDFSSDLTSVWAAGSDRFFAAGRGRILMLGQP